MISSNIREREREAERAELIVDSEVMQFQQALRALDIGPTLGALRQKLQDIARAEMGRQRNRLGALSPDQEKAIEAMLLATVNKISHPVMDQMRRACWRAPGLAVKTIAFRRGVSSVSKRTTRQTRVTMNKRFRDRLARLEARPGPGSWAMTRFCRLIRRSKLKSRSSRPQAMATDPLSQIGGKGVFTKELEDALLSRRIDLAVHFVERSAHRTSDGLALAATSERETRATPWSWRRSRL